MLSLGFAYSATAATRPVVPSDTNQWGNEVVRVTSSDPGGISIGSAGATLDSSGGSEAAARLHKAGAKLMDTPPVVDYCIDLTLTSNASGPYRVRFHFDTGGDDLSAALRRTGVARTAVGHRRLTPQDVGAISLTFTLDTNAAGTATTTGDSGLVGTLYDDTDTLVAGDDGLGGRISTTLAAGTYSLVIEGGDAFVGTYSAMADQGTCDE